MNPTYQRKRAAAFERRLGPLATRETAAIDAIGRYSTPRFETPADLPLDGFTPCEVGVRWRRNRTTTPADRRAADATPLDASELPEGLSAGENVWFRLEFTIPESMAGSPVFLAFVADPVGRHEGGMGPPHVECLCFRDGEPWQAFDDGHDELLLTDDAVGSESFDLLVEVGTTTLWGLLDVEEFVLTTAELRAVRRPVQKLERTVTVLNELRTEIEANSPNDRKLLRALVEASHSFDFETDDEDELAASAQAALDRLDACAENLTSDLTGYELTTLGHAHIDLAWLWPWSETVRKGGRTFSNVLTLMEEYPDFEFLQSQPHLYEFVRHRYPDLFKRSEGRIEAGSWHPTGALWVQADVNIAGGEALARQYLLGKRYFREAFEVDPRVTFIPDDFGYNAALPGIARAAGCPYFFTQKLSWNEVNDFPHSSFRWEGIDGSRVLSHFSPCDTYTGDMSVEQVRDSITDHDENAVHDEAAYLFGWGDGGGGPTREMLDRHEIIDDIGSLPDLSFDTLPNFFERLDAVEDLPEWRGELYLEKHRGTYTTQAETKRNNRKGEFALREAELWSSLAHLGGDEYPHDRLEAAWKVLLFNQFHDILPGSSVTDVYADADRDYRTVFETTDEVRRAALDSVLDKSTKSASIAVTNSLSWTRDALVEVPTESVPFDADEAVVAVSGEKNHPVQRVESGDEAAYAFVANGLPSLGISTVELEATDDPDDDGPTATTDRLENDHLCVEFATDGTIEATDLDADRTVFSGPANRLLSYRDHPDNFDAWDIEADLTAVGDQLPAPEIEVIETGPVRATVRQVREFGDSRLVQDLSLERGAKRLDIRSEIDWHEEERFLKAHFPMAVHTDEATYDIQFGQLTRPTHDNTSWDEARFEVPHQKWVDVAEHGYGVAVLNNGKYGVNVDGTDIALSLLRAPNTPDSEADRGHHKFTYSIRPHGGSLEDAGIIEAGYEVNAPVTAEPVTESVERSLCTVDTPGVIVESVKRAEDDDRVVLRLYEAYGRACETTLSFEHEVESAATATLIEDEEELIPRGNGNIELEFNAFEITTVLVDLSTPN